MSLTRGARLGSYEAAALVGAGGMGEVYRARDTKLNRDVALSWSLDGRSIFYSSGTGSSPTGNDVWVLPLVGDKKTMPVVHAQFNERIGKVSPDGRWIAYESNESGGGWELFVVPFNPLRTRALLVRPVAGSKSPRPAGRGRDGGVTARSCSISLQTTS